MVYRRIPRIKYIRNSRSYNTYSYVTQESNSILNENTAPNVNDKGLITKTDDTHSMNTTVTTAEDSSINHENSTASKASSRGTFFNSGLIGEIVLVILVILIITCLQ